MAATVPARGAFLAEHCIAPDAALTLDAFRELPLADVESRPHGAGTPGWRKCLRSPARTDVL
ncbi:hypothetical protein [Streptomyces sp. NPDC094149]|uniref:hypothetical protein n=1 Tax=Streptomyces sp. NPDC094149 TaxID=3155079 RepID=UPI00332306CE